MCFAVTRPIASHKEASLGAGWLGLRRDQIWSLASFDADWYSDVLELEVLYGALPARDEAGYNMQAEKRGCVLSNASFLDQLIFSFATKEVRITFGCDFQPDPASLEDLEA
eukprot:g33546.t1